MPLPLVYSVHIAAKIKQANLAAKIMDFTL